MEKFGKGQPVTRVEDIRFLTGRGLYVDDIAPPGGWGTSLIITAPSYVPV